MSDPYNNREIVNDFIRYKLTQRGYGQSGPSPPPPPPSSPPPPPSSQSTAQLLRVLRAAGDEFESRYRASFSDLSQQLHVSQGCAEQRFAEVTAELFRDGVNWGRVVAFLAFGAALCAECADKEMGFLVDGIAQWMANYLDEELRDWIQQNGGWDSFVSLYGARGGGLARRRLHGANDDEPLAWPSLKTVITGLAAVGACLTVGALFNVHK
ncbi:bcl-2-like protein 2 [Lampetra fluviatilis]